MATKDCTEEQVVIVTKFFRSLSTGKTKPIDPIIVPGLSEEDEFLTRINAELLFEFDIRIPKGRAKEWLEELKRALHVYISNTERDTLAHHEIIETIALVSIDG